MKNQDNKPKTVTGVDESGMFCITRPKFRPADLLILFLLFLALFSNGQNVETKDGGKTYKERDKCNIEIVCSIPKKLGASELRWNGTFDELVEILLKQQTKTA